MTLSFWNFWTFLAVSQPKMIQFSFCKKPLEGKNNLSLMAAPTQAFSSTPGVLIYGFTVFPWGGGGNLSQKWSDFHSVKSDWKVEVASL